MELKKAGAVILQLAVVSVVLFLILGSVLSQPILLSYVETGSMSPALDPGDGFIALPAQIDSSVEQGDVIVFRAEELHGGSLTTHRVVGETDRGLITKGDANPVTDQSGKEPPVKRAQVVAVVPQVNGHIVVIPHLGTAVEGTQSALSAAHRQLAFRLGVSTLSGPQGLAYLFFTVTVLWYAVGEWRGRNGRGPDRDGGRDDVTSRATGVDSRLVMGAFAMLIVVGASAAMVVPAGTQEYGIVSADFTSEKPNVVPAGESKTQQYVVGNGGVLPVVTYLEPASEGVTVQPEELYVEGRSTANATVTLHAPPETGYYRRFVVQHRYLGVLPQPVIRGLYGVHPWAPIAAIDAVIAVPFYFVGLRLMGRGRVWQRSVGRDLPTATRVRRAIRSLYR